MMKRDAKSKSSMASRHIDICRNGNKGLKLDIMLNIWSLSETIKESDKVIRDEIIDVWLSLSIEEVAAEKNALTIFPIISRLHSISMHCINGTT